MKVKVRIYFSPLKIRMVLNKLKSKSFRTSSLFTYGFSTLYTTLPHILLNEKLDDLIDWPFHREGSLYLVCNGRNVCLFLLRKA